MKRAILIFLLGWFSWNLGFSQVQVFQRPANPYQFESKDIWNLDVISPYQSAFRVRFAGQIISSEGRTLVELRSGVVNLSPGLNSLTPFTVSTERINYLDKDIQEIENLTKNLPAGNYRLCVQLTCLSNDCDGIGQGAIEGEPVHCIPLNLEQPTPLLLALPENESEIKTTRPLFVWIPPGPVAMSQKLNYSIRVVEKREGQSRMDAMRRNRPIIQKSGEQNTSLPYPADMDELIVGNSYAWQVEAYVGKTYVASSEVWEFKVVQDTFDYEKVPRTQSYVDIQQLTPGNIFYAVGLFKIKYSTRFEVGKMTYSITDDKKGRTVETESNEFEIKSGENRFQIDLEDVFGMEHLAFYTLGISDAAGKSYVIKFQYVDPKFLK